MSKTISNLHNTTRVALYCRVACEGNDAIEQQTTIVRGYAKGHGYSNFNLYIDNVVSGVSPERPAFSHLNRDIADMRIDVVIVRDLSRITRNSLELSDWIDSLRRKGVSLISLSDSIIDESFFLTRL